MNTESGVDDASRPRTPTGETRTAALTWGTPASASVRSDAPPPPRRRSPLRFVSPSSTRNLLSSPTSQTPPTATATPPTTEGRPSATKRARGGGDSEESENDDRIEEAEPETPLRPMAGQFTHQALNYAVPMMTLDERETLKALCADPATPVEKKEAFMRALHTRSRAARPESALGTSVPLSYLDAALAPDATPKTVAAWLADSVPAQILVPAAAIAQAANQIYRNRHFLAAGACGLTDLPGLAPFLDELGRMRQFGARPTPPERTDALARDRTWNAALALTPAPPLRAQNELEPDLASAAAAATGMSMDTTEQ